MFAYCLNKPTCYADSTGNRCVPAGRGGDMFGRTPVTDPNPAPTPQEQTYGVINGQELLPYADVKIGLGSYGKSGCAYIAAYNALQLTGKGKSLSVVTNEIYHDYGSMLFGAFGVGPVELAVYLRDQGIVTAESANLSTLTDGVVEGSVITFTAWNYYNNPLGGWHAMTALYSNGKYLVFNRYDTEPNTLRYTSLSESFGGVFLYGVRIDP